jgi:uncharacterized protein (DUF736 family)
LELEAQNAAAFRLLRLAGGLAKTAVHEITVRAGESGGVFVMPLKLRPSGLGSGIDKDRPDYTVYTGGWEIGRIYQTRGGPDNLRWFWSLTVNGPMTRSDKVATLEEAKAQFQKSWNA